MKTKKFNKKLALNKKTVADLNGSDMDYAHGGGIPPCELTQGHSTCPTADISCGGTCAASECQSECPLICR
jgi:hypothetical protein